MLYSKALGPIVVGKVKVTVSAEVVRAVSVNVKSEEWSGTL